MMEDSESQIETEKHCLSGASSEDLTSDDLFNDIINVAYALEKSSAIDNFQERTLEGDNASDGKPELVSQEKYNNCSSSEGQTDKEYVVEWDFEIGDLEESSNNIDLGNNEPASKEDYELQHNMEESFNKLDIEINKTASTEDIDKNTLEETGNSSRTSDSVFEENKHSDNGVEYRKSMNGACVTENCSKLIKDEETTESSSQNIPCGNFCTREKTGNNVEGCNDNVSTLRGSLSSASSKSSFSDSSISNSRTDSESGLADHTDGFKEDCYDDTQRARQKSYSLTSTQSEMDFVLNHEKERRYARFSLERDKRPPIYSGFLVKLGGTGFTPKNWRKRWFVLKRDNCLYYYKNPQNDPVGAVILSNYLVTTIAIGINKKFAFQLTKGGARAYTFAAASDIERKTWMKVISDAANMPDRTPTSPETSIHNVSIPALSIKDPECHGYLWKQGFSHKSWKRRYCVLKTGCLYYYQDMSETVAIGVFNLHCYSMQETESTGRKYSFIAIPPQSIMRTYYFSAESQHDRERWLQAMDRSIDVADEEEQ